MTRVIVCGGRDFSDKELFASSLDTVLCKFQNVEIISGHAKGADSFAEEYASLRGYPLTVFRPDWNKYGRSAGPIRNRQMLEYACQETPVVIAFWDGKSRGTRNMLRISDEANAQCYTIRY